MSSDAIRIPALLVLAALLVAAAPARAQTDWAVGDRVEVDVNMASDPAYESWKAGTITGIQVWQGQVSGIFVRTDDGLEVTSAARFMRPGPPAPAAAGTGPGTAPAGGSTGAVATAAAPAGSTTPAGGPPADPGSGNCRVGTRVTDREGRSGVVTRATGRAVT